MISNTPFPETNDTGRRKFLGKLVAVGGLGLLAGKLFPKAAGASVDGRYKNNMPSTSTKTSPWRETCGSVESR